jgi:hypothetical protein
VRGRTSTRDTCGFTAKEQRVRTYILAHGHVRPDSREYRESYAETADACSCSKATVSRTVTKMAGRGEIAVERLRFTKGPNAGRPAWNRLVIQRGTRRLPRAHPSSIRAPEAFHSPDPAIFWNAPNRRPVVSAKQVFRYAKNLARAPVCQDTKATKARKPRLVRSRGARPCWRPFEATSRAAERAVTSCRRPPRGGRGVVRVAALAVAGLTAEDRGVLGRQASRLLAEGVSFELVAIGAVRCGAAGSPWSLRRTVFGPLAVWWRDQERHRVHVRAQVRPTSTRQRSSQEECVDADAAEHWLPYLRERYGRKA